MYIHATRNTHMPVAVILGILTGELDLAFVGLSAGVGEQHLVEAAVLDDELRGLDGGLIVEVVGAVQDRVGALFEALHDRGKAALQVLLMSPCVILKKVIVV